MSRILAVARLHSVGWPTTIGWPWGILASSFVLNLAIFAGIGGHIPDDPITGGLASIYVVTLIQGVASITQLFPFALGMSTTRRTFYIANSLILLAQSVVFGVLLYLLKLVEDGTGGWGLSLRFFAPPLLAQQNALLQILVYTVPFIVLGFLGICVAGVHTRWGLNGMFTLSIATALLLGGLVALASWQGWWPAIGDWLAGQSTVSLFAGWPMLLALALAGTGYLNLRRATP